MMQKRLYVTVLIMMLTAFHVLADQLALDTFITEDGSFSFDYPVDWVVEVINPQRNNQHLYVSNYPREKLSGQADHINLQISLPQKYYDIDYIILNGETPAEMVTASLQFTSQFGQNPTSSPTLEFATPSADGTPQALELQSGKPDVIEFTVDGRPAAYGYVTIRIMGEDFTQMIIIADLGNDYLVSISVDSLEGGLETIKQYETAVVDIVRSMRFTPPEPVHGGNPDLPQVYSGIVGITGRGSIHFFYPEDWYAFNNGIIVLTNVRGISVNTPLEVSQFIAGIQGVSETISSVDRTAAFNECNFQASDWTARELVSTLLDNITPAQAEQLENRGITLTQPEVVTVNDVEIVYFRQYYSEYEILSMYVDLGEGQVTLISVTALQGEMAQFEEEVFSVASTLQYTPIPCEDVETED